MALNPSGATSPTAAAAPQGQGYKGTNLNIILDALTDVMVTAYMMQHLEMHFHNYLLPEMETNLYLKCSTLTSYSVDLTVFLLILGPLDFIVKESSSCL
jgi:hypothetical protein